MDKLTLSHPLASGRTADIYTWEVGYVLKVFQKWVDVDSIQTEARLAGAVQASGLPVPNVGEILQVDGHYGLVYERVHGPDLFTELRRQSWRVIRFARRLAALHAGMHTRTCTPEFPPQRERLERKIRGAAPLSPDDQTKIIEALRRMPVGDRICHGDFHPGNVLLAEKGEVIIDWIDATCGNPLADVARSSIIALGVAESDQIPNLFLKTFVRLFHAVYLRRYFQLQPGDEQEYRRWLPIVAAARLSEGIPELETWLLTQANKAR